MKNNFDILRLTLSILVFFAHWNILTAQNISNPLFHFSSYAVDSFFIISGFLIFLSYDNNQNKKAFYIKRFFRIFPLYIFLIVLQTIFFIAYSDSSSKEIIKYFTANMVFMNFISYSVGDIFSNLQINAINGSLWTLKNEVAFYIFVPFIFTFYKKFGYKFLFSLYILSVLYMFAVDYMGITKLLVQFPAQLRLFITGIGLYLFMKKIETKMLIVLVPLSIISIFFFYTNDAFRFAMYPLFLGIIVMYLVYFTKIGKINFDFSYSFYILHFPVIQLVLYFNVNPTNPMISFIGIFLFILFISYLSEKYIEKKFIRIGKRYAKGSNNDSN